MKRKSQNFRQDFKMPHLFREDLEDIENIVKDLSPQECKFETKDFEYKTVQEIPNNINLVNDFHIQVYNPYISLDLNKNSAYIYSSEDDIKTMGVVKKITDIILKRERRFLWYFSKSSIFLAPLLIWFQFFFSKETIKSNKIVFVLAIIIICIVAIILWIIGYQSDLKKFSVIEFSYKKKKSNFFIRNKDQIIVGIIVAIISVVATLFFQKLFK